MTNSADTDQPNRRGRRRIAIAVTGAAAGIILASVLTACGGGNDKKTVSSAETRTTPAATGTPSTEAEPKVLAFHRNDGGSTPTTGQSSSSTATPTPRASTATPTRTPTPSTSKPTATATQKPGSSGSSTADSDPGDLATFDDVNSYKFIVHKEYSGAVGSAKWDRYHDDLYQGYDSLFPSSKPTGDKPFVVDITGTYIAPDRFQTTTKLGGPGKLTDTIVGNKWASQLSTDPADTGTLKDAFAQDDYSEAAAIWDNGFLPWLDDVDGVTVNCHSISDKINGMAARDCLLSQPSKDDLFDLIDLFGGSSIQHNDATTLEFWLAADQNIPLRFRLNVTGKDKDGKSAKIVISTDLTDVNSKALKVDLPK